MSLINNVVKGFRALLGRLVKQPMEATPAVAMVAYGLLNPKTNAVAFYVNASGQIVDGSGNVVVAANTVVDFVTAADATARLALTTATVRNGDHVKETDTGYIYELVDDTDISTAGSWVKLKSILLADIVDATTVGKAIGGLTNPSAITFLRINANNTVTARSAANFLSDIAGAPLASPTFTGTVTAPIVNATSTTNENAFVLNTTASTIANVNVISVRHTDAVGGCSAVRFINPSNTDEIGAVGVGGSFAGGLFHCTYLEGSDASNSGSGLPIRIIQSSTLGSTIAYGSRMRMEIAVTAGGAISFGNSVGTANICVMSDGYLKVGTTGQTGQIQVAADSGFTTGGLRFLNNAGAVDGMLAQAADNNIYLLMSAGSGGNQFNVIRPGDFVSCFKVNNSGNLVQLGDTFNQATQKTPASAAAAGVAGDICHDASFVYVCTATNTWKRAAISTW